MGRSPAEAALDATAGLTIEDRAWVLEKAGGFAPVFAAGAAVSTLGADAQTGNVVSVGAVTLRDRARVNGNLTTAGAITLGNDVVVTGSQQHHVAVPLDRYSWSVTFPQSSTNVSVPVDGSQAIAPGVYANVQAFSGATLSLRTGTYYADSLTIEPQAKLAVDTTNGPVFLYVRQTLVFRGTTVLSGPSDRLLIGYAGTAPPALDTTTKATIVAPFSSVRLGVGGSPYAGAVYAAGLALDPNVRFVHEGFSGWNQLAFDVNPTLSCIDKRPDNTFAAVLGYFNPNASPVTVAVGTSNAFSGTQNRGQPTTFLPGRFASEFTVDFNQATSLSWQLSGVSLPMTTSGTPCQATVTKALVQDATVTSTNADANFGAATTLTVSSTSQALVQFDRAQIKKELGAGRFVSKAILRLTKVSGVQPSVEALALTRRWTELGATWNCANDTDPSATSAACNGGDTWKLERDDLTQQNPWSKRSAARTVLGTFTASKLEFDVTRDVWNLLGSDGARHPAAWALVEPAGTSGSVVLGSRESATPPQLVLTFATRPTPSAPLAVAVDSSVVPEQTSVTPLVDGAQRPVAAVRDPDGAQAEFVERELLFDVKSDAELQPILARWNGTLVADITPPARAPFMSRTAVVRIDASRAQPAALLPRLLELDNRPVGAHGVSSANGLATIAAAAEEALAGRKVTINWVLRDDAPSASDWASRNVFDGAFQDASQPFSTNPFFWPGFASCDPDPADPNFPQRCRTTLSDGSPIYQQLTIADAWRALAMTGRLLPGSVPVAIIDAGFTASHPDYPAISVHGDLHEQNDRTPGHGHRALLAGFAQAGNRFGAAGPGGPVGKVQIESISNSYDGNRNAIARTFQDGARIISMSRHAEIPAVLTIFTATDYQEIRSQNTLIFSAAGNEGKNVDAEHCVCGPFGCIVCWERVLYTPCEEDGVNCVTGMEFNRTWKDPRSNYGSDTHTIAGPYTTHISDVPVQLVNGILESQPDSSGAFSSTFKFWNGTSAATPFVAGIASLLVAADPTASGDRIEHCLFEPIHPNTDGAFNTLVPDALASIKCMITGGSFGDLPPYIHIDLPADGASVSSGQFVNVRATATDYEIGTLSVSWSSDIDGKLASTGSGTIGALQLKTPGTHHLTAKALGSGGVSVSQTITVVVGNPSPGAFGIVRPSADGALVPQGLPMAFEAQLASVAQPPCSSIKWSSTSGTGLLDFDGLTGCTIQPTFQTLGFHSLVASTTHPVTGQLLVANRTFDVVAVTNFLAQITSPVNTGNTQGIFDQPLTLAAQHLNGTNVSYEWSLTVDSTTVSLGSSAAPVTFLPTDYLTEICAILPVQIDMTATDAVNGAQSHDSEQFWLFPSAAFLNGCVQ